MSNSTWSQAAKWASWQLGRWAIGQVGKRVSGQAGKQERGHAGKCACRQGSVQACWKEGKPESRQVSNWGKQAPSLGQGARRALKAYKSNLTILVSKEASGPQQL